MSDLGLLIADDYLDSDEFLNSSVELKSDEEQKAERKVKIIKIIFCVLCLVLLGEFVAYKYIMPSFASPKVTVSGQKNYSAEEIARMLLSMNSSTWFDFNVNQAAAIISSESGIENVIVEKKFPDKININITERKPVAVTFVSNEGSTSLVQIDKNGVLFPSKSNVMPDSNNIPIISGLPIEYLSSGMRIPSMYRPLIDEISKIGEMPQKFFASISEICVIPKEYGYYELALIPLQSKIKVLTDRTLNEEELKYMMVVLDVVDQIGSEVTSIDLRYGSVSYTTNE